MKKAKNLTFLFSLNKRIWLIFLLFSIGVVQLPASITVNSTCSSYSSGSLDIDVTGVFTGNVKYVLKDDNTGTIISETLYIPAKTYTFSNLPVGRYRVDIIEEGTGDSVNYTRDLGSFPVLDGGTIASDQSVCNAGDPALLTNSVDAAGGSGVIQYDWEYSDNGGASWTSLSWNFSTYDPPAGLTANRLYRRKAWNTCPAVYSNTITISVYGVLSAGSINNPNVSPICYGSVPVITGNLLASGGSGVTYQWEYNPGSGYVDISGATSSNLTNAPSLTSNSTFRRKAVDPICGTATSNAVTVNVYPQTTPGAITIAKTQICGDNPSTVPTDPENAGNFTSVTPASGGKLADGIPVAYQWQSKTTGTWTNITAATALGYNPNPLLQTTSFRRRAYIGCDSVYSNVITITVSNKTTPVITITKPLTCFNGSDAQFTASVTGGIPPYHYVWERSNTGTVVGPWTVVGGDSPVLDNVNQGLYRVTITDAVTCWAVSKSIRFVYGDPSALGMIPAAIAAPVASAQNHCSDKTVANLTATPPSGCVVDWYLAATGGAPLPSATPLVTGTYYAESRNTTTGCTSTTRTSVSVTVTPIATADAGGAIPAICQGGTTIGLGGSVGGSATGGTWSTPAGGVFTASATDLNATWTPPAGYSGTATLTLTSSGGCGVATSTKTVTVNPNATINLTSGAVTNIQTVCISTPITNITYSIGGGGTGAGVTGLPAGVSGVYAGGVFTISGTPSVAGTYNYTVTTTGTCTQATATGTITVNPDATISLTSGAGSNIQTVCISTPITNITYSIGGGGTGAGVAGLPAGVSGAYAGGVFTISGTPSVAGTYNYTVTTTGTCTQTTATGTITVTAAATANAGGAIPAICQGGTTIGLGGSVGGSATGGTWSTPAGGVFTASANDLNATWTPPAGYSGTATLTLTSSGGCGVATSTKTVLVNPNATISLTSGAGSNIQTVCISTPITNITYSIGGGGTGAGVAGLPAGVSGAYAGGVFTISGTPSVAGTYNYTVTTTGTCTQTTATGTITVTAAATANAGGAIPAICQGGTTIGLGGSVGGSATGGTWSTPAGGVFTASANDLNATWTPPAGYSGTATLTLTSSGGCGVATSTKTVLVNPNATINLTSGVGTNIQTVCISTPITNITYSIGGGGTGAGVAGLPAGVSGVYAGGVFTISGTPSVAGTYNYTVTTTGTCTQTTATGTITVTAAATANAGVAIPAICQGGTTIGLGGSVGGSATGGTWSTPAGGVFTASANDLNATWTPPAGYSGTATLTLTSSGGCGVATSTKTVLVNPNATINLTSGVGTNIQTVCISTPITNITYSIGGGGTGAGVTGLPAGVSGVYAGGVFTISGTPSVAGTYNYTVTTTGTCTQATATGTITVNPDATISLTSGAGSNIQTVCISTPITNITYSIGGGGTGAGVSGLPAGVSGVYAGGVFTISGTPSVAGTYNYTVTTTGTCTQTTATGTITVTAAATVNAGGAIPAICQGGTTIGLGGSVGGSATGGTWSTPAGGVFTASATDLNATWTPPAGYSGTATLTLTSSGGCGVATSTKTVLVNPNATINLTSGVGTNIQTVCISTPITNITYSIGGGGTGAGVTGLPAGVSGVYAGGVFTISGTPSVAGTYNYTVTTTGTCTQTTATGTITVTAAATANAGGAIPAICQGETTIGLGGSVGGSATGGTWSTPAGGVFTASANDLNATWTPPAGYSGTATLTLTSSGGCGVATSTKTVLVNPNATINLTSGAGSNIQTVCISTPITNITYSIGGGGTGAGVAGLPAGVNGVYAGGVFTISGTPSVAGTYNYTVTTTGTCTQTTATGTITVTAAATANAGVAIPAVCQGGTTIGLGGSVGGSATGGTWSTPAGGVFTASATDLNATWTPPAGYSGTATLTLTSSGGCGVATSTKTVTVNPNATINLTSGAGTNIQTVCISTPITNITYSIGGGGTGAGVTGLPAGVSGVYAGGVFTISGTPSVAGTYNYTVTTTGTCTQATATGTITVNPDATISLTSGAGSNIQTVCISTPITNITYSIGGGGTGAGVVGLPAGVSGAYAGGVFTISGTPSVAGTYNYTVTTTGTCTQVTATGTITVNPDASISLTSGAGTNLQSLCVNTAIAPITYSIGGGGTGAGVTGLPAGVNGVYAGGVFTISGNPSVAGTYNYTVTTTGTCAQVTATGTITVNPDATINLTSGAGSNIQTVCISTPITNITYSIGGGGTGADVTGLPAGVSGAYAGGVFTISGTPSVAGTYNYTVTTTGTCTQTTATGTITVTAAATANAGGAIPAICQGGTTIGLGGSVGGSATGGTWSTPAGGVFTASANDLNATWTPPAGYSGTATLTLTSNGGCGVATSTKTVLVNPNATVSLTSAIGSDDQTLCINTVLTPITYSIGGGGTGANVTGLPAGLSGVYAGGEFIISGTPSIDGTFNYTVTTTGTCTQTSITGTITVTPDAVISLSSVLGTDGQNICINSPLTDITYLIAGGGTGAVVSGLPAGIIGTFNSGVFTISGTPTESGTFNYTVTTTGTCLQAQAVGSVIINPLPVVFAGADITICHSDDLSITDATASDYTNLKWTTSGDGIFTDEFALVTTYSPGPNDRSTGSVVLSLTASSLTCSDVTSSRTVTIAPELVASIGSFTPYLIGAGTRIEVGIKVKDRQALHSIGFNLVAPDGTKVTLKDNDFGCFSIASTANVVFTNKLPATQTYNICDPSFIDQPLSGTFGATGDWSSLFGKDPANGAWRVEVVDCDNGYLPGVIENAFILFKDIDVNGDSIPLNYNSGSINYPIKQSSNFFTCYPTDYIVPMGLRTKCSSSCDARAVVTVVGGVGPYTYEWSDAGLPSNSTVDLCKGTYTVTVTDAIGCKTTATVDVTSPDPIKIDAITYEDTVACYGNTTDLTLTAQGGTSSLRYSVDGSTFKNVGETFTGLAAGSYSIRVLDVNNCEKDTTIIIHQPTELVLDSVTHKQILCVGGNNGEIRVYVKGGTSPYKFDLSDGTSNATGIFTGLIAGSYTVTVTDKNGCGNIVTTPVNLVDPPALVVSSVESTNVKCFGEDNGSVLIHANGGTKPYTFSVDGGVTFQEDSTFNTLIAGIYNPVVKDANGCETTDAPVTITEPTDLVITSVAKVDVTSCYESPEGSIDVTASGGTGPLLYSINGGVDFFPTSSFTGLFGGTYSIVVQDASLCTETQTVVIDRPAEIVVTSLTHTNVSGISKGSIHVEATGGTGSITYSIGGAFQASGDFIDLDPGTYTVTIKDSKPCFIERTVVISDLIVDVKKKDVKCYGETTGEIILTILSGGNNILYSIDDGVTSQDSGQFHNLASGMYNVKVWDETGASFVQAVAVGSGAEIVSSVLISNITTCAGSNSGALLVLASGGTGNRKYSIDDGVTYQKDSLFNNLVAANYAIRIADDSGCYIPKTAVITEPPVIVITTSTTQVRGMTKGTVHVDATGGTGTLQYSLDGITYQASPDFADLDAKTYTVYVKDANDCVKSADFEITQSPFSVSIIVNNACNGDNGAIAVSCADCVTGTQYSVDDGATFQDGQLFGNLKVGSYKLVIRFTSGPDYKDIVNVRHPGVTANIVDASCRQITANGSIQLTLNNANSATFLWSNGSTEQNISNLRAGKYKVTYVTDQNCTVKDSFVVKSIDSSYVFAGRDTALCPGKDLEMKATGNNIDPSENIIYSWLRGDTAVIGNTSSVFVTPDVPSTYVVYMNYKSCISKDTISVNLHPVLGLYAGKDTTVGEGYALQLNATSGTGFDFVRYKWEPSDYLDSDTLKSPMLTPSGAQPALVPYTVIATTLEGCIEIDTVYISIVGKIHPYSGFTPNGDQVNDYWVIDNAEAYPDLNVTVFNRWGEKVFQSKGYGGDKKFDGTRNGKNLPEGTYYYVIESGDGSNRKSGPLTIMR